jgi:hypothetical protein
MTKARRTPEQMLDYLHRRCHDEGDCRLWIGTTHDPGGTPVVMWRGKRWLARRLLLTLMGKSIEGRFVYDVCGERTCMNPEHLRVGSRGDAVRQAARNGAYPTGLRRALLSSQGEGAKLRMSDAPDVLRMRAEGMTLTEIAPLYGVTYSAVSKALIRWRRAGIAQDRPPSKSVTAWMAEQALRVGDLPYRALMGEKERARRGAR